MNWETACVTCSAGWAIALASFLILENPDKTAPWTVRVGMLVVLFMFLAGVGMCAVEDRVCEVSERINNHVAE